jgi:hypothetical protein
VRSKEGVGTEFVIYIPLLTQPELAIQKDKEGSWLFS